MNLLAHIHLAYASQHELHGALLGDYIKGNGWQAFPQPTAAAILQHRAIDSRTDKHPWVKAQQTASGSLRRYQGIVLDILMDHWLCQLWPEFHTESLAEFEQRAFAQLRQNYVELQHQLPSNYCSRHQLMLQQNWLSGYADYTQIQQAVYRTGLRLKKPLDLRPCLAFFPAQAPNGFADYYADMLEFACSW